MTAPVVVIGAGVGGLAAALRLRRLGHEVLVLEAGEDVGGLAAGLRAAGLAFDGGPYILLDRPGLEWAFERIGLSVEETLHPALIEEPYQVSFHDGDPVRIHADLECTADEFEARWPGAGVRYRRFVAEMKRVHERILPLLFVSRPRPWHAVKSLRFLMESLRSVLGKARLPTEVIDALGVWTHVAGQTLSDAPAPMGLIPALLHTTGAWYPRGGLRTVPEALGNACRNAGVTLRTRTPVRAVVCRGGRAVGVELADGACMTAAAVLSNYNGVGTYLELVGDVPARARARLEALPLQSPGVGAWLRVRRQPEPPYLRFHIPDQGQRCRLFVATAEADPTCERDGWSPARLVVPMDHAVAERLSEKDQHALLDRMLEEPWWHHGIADHEVLVRRVPAGWGRRCHLYRDSMNPVMTARFMRSGRIAHRSPYLSGLYLAGSSTHPGQWVSFCAISGVHAANALHDDSA